MKEIVNLFENSDWYDAPEYSEGVKKRVLNDEKNANPLFLQLPKGFYMASHASIAVEQQVILKGDYISDRKVYHAGTYKIFKAHENHGPFRSKNGALVTVIWDSYQANA